jgi:hypothetical protein
MADGQGRTSVAADRMNSTRVPWERLHALLLERLRAAHAIEWSRAVIESRHVQAKKRGAEPAIPLCVRYTTAAPTGGDFSAKNL